MRKISVKDMQKHVKNEKCCVKKILIKIGV